MKCIVALTFLALVVIQFVSAENADFECDPQKRYIENDCNRCNCGRGGLVCSLMACEPQRKNADCSVGSTFQKNGKQCWCVKSMGIVCEY